MIHWAQVRFLKFDIVQHQLLRAWLPVESMFFSLSGESPASCALIAAGSMAMDFACSRLRANSVLVATYFGATFVSCFSPFYVSVR